MLQAWKNVYKRRSNNIRTVAVAECEKDAVKDRILEDVGRTIKLLLQYGLSEESVGSDCWVAHDLCHRLEEALHHGVRRPSSGFWPYIRLFTHADNVRMLDNLKTASTALEKGRAWLHHSLNEGSLESYLRASACENSALRKHYGREALLRDASRRELLLGLLASLQDVQFELELGPSNALRTSTISLPSPEDSGVALLDSDLSEPLDSLQDDQEEDTATLNEMEDNRINRLLSLEMDTAGKCIDPCIPQLVDSETVIEDKADEIVLRTPKRCANDSNRHLKRVSFHEESFSQTDFSISFVAPGTAVPKKDTVKGRYSWCAGGDAPFVFCDKEPKTNSLCVLQHEEERGVPEGQEDSIHSEHHVRTKIEVLRLRRRQLLKKQNKSKRLLHWPGAKPNPQACQQLLHDLEQEISSNICRKAIVSPLSESSLNILKSKIFFHSAESLYKVFKAHGPLMQPHISPLLIILTNKGFYVVGQENGMFQSYLSLNYGSLKAVLLGPGGQAVMVIGKEKQKIMVAMSDSEVASDLLAHMELAMRRARAVLPVWKWLALEDMKSLWQNLAQIVPCLQGERLLHYCLVHLQDETKQSSSPGPNKEGLLMMRIGQTGPWLPAFLGLRDTELWVFGDEVEREPQLVVSLARCQGCHRAPSAGRPHTFEILCGRGSSPLQLAAADEYEASDWLQALLQAASGPAEPNYSKLELCGMVLSAGHLLAFSLDECPQLVCCAALPHLTALRTQHIASTWCAVEFECSEAHESSGDWILYFGSAIARARFCVQLEAVWPSLFESLFPNTEVVSDSLKSRCKEASSHLAASWNPLLYLDATIPM